MSVRSFSFHRLLETQVLYVYLVSWVMVSFVQISSAHVTGIAQNFAIPSLKQLGSGYFKVSPQPEARLSQHLSAIFVQRM
ncbi:hypothetical protein DFJ73DRAFT_828387, partial [Zopfochytrium polystomum]